MLSSLDLSWNLGAENQAYDRAHRIGQSKPVQIKRFIVKDTIEARRASIGFARRGYHANELAMSVLAICRILELQRDKQQMADATLGEGDAPVRRVSSSLTTRELTSVSHSHLQQVLSLTPSSLLCQTRRMNL